MRRLQRVAGGRALMATAAVIFMMGCGSTTAAPGGGTLVTIKHSTNPTASDAAIFVALDQGFFRQNGINLQLSLHPRGVDGAALLSGESNVENLGFNQVADLRRQGKDVIGVYALLRRSTVSMVVSNKAAAAKGLSPDQPLAERLRRLKGLRFGITAPGTANDVATRYLLRLGGHNPETDAQVISLGSFAGQTAALSADQIDAFVGPPPVPQQVALRGGGIILIKSSIGEVPGLANFYFAVLTMRSDFVAQNPGAVRSYDRALQQAYAWIVTHREGALKSVEQRLINIDAATVALGYDTVFPTFSPDGRFTPEYVASTLDIFKQAGVLDTIPSLAEGGLWTNRYSQ